MATDKKTAAAVPVPEAQQPAAEAATVTVTNMAGTLDDKNAGRGEEQYSDFGGGSEEQTNAIDPELAAVFIRMPFDLAAAYLGEHWTLSNGEAKLIADPAAKLFSRLFAQLSDRSPDAVAFALALLAVAGPRTLKTVKQVKRGTQPEEAPHVTSSAAGETHSAPDGGSGDYYLPMNQ